MAQITIEQFEILLPHAIAWVAEQERTALENGVPLTKSQLADARLIGVLHPDRVRLLSVKQIPALPLALAPMATMSNLVTPDTDGMTVRYGILILEKRWNHRRLVVHELVHTSQYERLGGIEAFLRPYLWECITPPGYPQGPMEQEAVTTSARLCI
jgi:hypothetical protein